MKKLLLIILSLCQLAAFSQQVSLSGIVRDSQTDEPVIAASVGIKNSAAGTITNEDGAFRVMTQPGSVVVISSIGYKTKEIGASEFEGSNVKAITLDAEVTSLEEVIVTKTPIDKILADIVAVSRARFNKPIILHTYYREFVKINGKHSRFADGMLDYHISGNTKKTNSDLIITQSRVAQLINEAELEGEDLADTDSFVNVKKAVSDYYDFNFLTRLLKNADDYEFTLKSKKDREGRELLVINYEPKPDQDKFLVTGSVTYDPYTKLIIEIAYGIDEAHLKFPKSYNLLLAHFAFEDVKGHSTFKIVGNNYVLSYSNRYNKLRIWKKDKFNETIESRSDLLVTDFSKEDMLYDKKKVFSKKSLFENGSRYNGKFWMQNNAIVLTPEEERIISDLEKKAVANP